MRVVEFAIRQTSPPTYIVSYSILSPAPFLPHKSIFGKNVTAGKKEFYKVVILRFAQNDENILPSN